MKDYVVLTEPLSRDEMVQQMRKTGEVEGIIAVDLGDVVSNDLEGFLDLVSEELTGSSLLSGTNYHIMGHEGNTLHLRVKGDAALILEAEE